MTFNGSLLPPAELPSTKQGPPQPSSHLTRTWGQGKPVLTTDAHRGTKDHPTPCLKWGQLCGSVHAAELHVRAGQDWAPSSALPTALSSFLLGVPPQQIPSTRISAIAGISAARAPTKAASHPAHVGRSSALIPVPPTSLLTL